MRVLRHDDADGFASAAIDFLLRDEARNNFFIAVIPQLSRPTQVFLATVEDANKVVAVAMMTPKRHLCITEDAPPEAIDALATSLIEQRILVPGVQASPDSAERFAQLWIPHVGATRRDGLNLSFYKLQQVTWPPRVNGTLREAVSSDVDLLARWVDSFITEIGDTPGDGAAMALTLIDQHRLHLWELGGKPLSMAAWARPTANGCAINFVYTPLAFRGKGYASAAVANLSQKMLNAGKKFCTLYTDRSNPTSNSIYQKIGYRFVSHSQQIFFDPTPGGPT